jgi:hypothetical protein
MTQNLPAPKPQIMAGGQVAALIPQSLDEAFRVSQAIAASGLAPRGIDKAEQIMVAIMAGAELGLAPFQSLQSFAVVNGRPTLWGDGLIAVVRARGVRVKEWLEGEGDGMVANCLAIRPDTGEEVERTFSVTDAKKAGLWGKTGPWQQYPKRMLQMRARALALRDGCADMLRGIQVREEVEDYQPVRDVTPRPSGLRERLEARQEAASEGFTASQAETRTQALDEALDGDQIPAHDAETGEVIDAEVEEKASEEPAADEAEPFDLLTWAAEVNLAVDKAETLGALNAVTDAEENKARFADLEADKPAVAKALVARINGKRKALADREGAGQ